MGDTSPFRQGPLYRGPLPYAQGGGAPPGPTLWTPADGGFLHWLDHQDATVRVTSGSNITQSSDKGSAGGVWAQANAANQPVLQVAAVNGLDAASGGDDTGLTGPTRYLERSVTLALGWSAFFVFKNTQVVSPYSALSNGTGSTFLGTAELASASTSVFIISGTSGSPNPTVRLNGAAASWANRGNAHSGIVRNRWQTVALTGLRAFTGTLRAFGGDAGYQMRGSGAHLIIKNSNFATDEVENLEGWAAHLLQGEALADLDAGHTHKASPPVLP